MSTFGTWLAPRQVEQALIDHCLKWGVHYIAEAERQFGIPARSLPVPERGQYTTVRDEFEKWPEDQTPVVLVIAPGLRGEPRREADRTLTAPVGLGLGVVASIPGFEGMGAEVAQLLGLSLRNLILTLPPEGIEVEAVDIVDERYGDIPSDKSRSMGAARFVFNYWVRNWADLKARPKKLADPLDDPYAVPEDWPRVESVFTTINNARRIP